MQTLDYPVGFSPAYDQHRDVIKTLDLKTLRPYKEWRDFQNTLGMVGELALRERHIYEIGFPILTKEVAHYLACALHNKRVVEVGCGTGFLASKLRDAGVEVVAIDSFETKYTKGTFANRCHGHVHQANALEYDITNFDAVILSWPDYNKDFAYRVAKKMRRGQYLVYQGEGSGGCTADERFFNELYANFQYFPRISSKLNDFHTQFDGIHDWWEIYRKT